MHAQKDGKPAEAIIDPRDAWLYNRETEFYQSDEWMVHYQKVLICPQRNPHSWVDCPFAHKGERAKRRDLRTHSYSSDPCDHARKNLPCPRGDACDKSHHVYESWLHPELYRTRMCAAGLRCVRRVCFFAHSAVQLRRPPKASGSTAEVQSSAQQQQQQQDGAGADLAVDPALSQDAEFTGVVEPWPESWGFGAAAAAAAAAASTAVQDARAQAQQQQQQQQQQQRVSSCSADVGTTTVAAGNSRAATPCSGRVSAELPRQQQQQHRHNHHHHQQQQQQQPSGTLHAASSGTSASLSLLQTQQQYMQQQHLRRNSNTSRQSSGGEACLPSASMLSNNCSPVVQHQQWQQFATTLSPDVAIAAAAAVGSPTGPWSHCNANANNNNSSSSSSSNRQVVGCTAHKVSSSVTAAPAEAAAQPCSNSQYQLMQLHQAIDASRGGTGQQLTGGMAAAAAAAGAGAELLHGRGAPAGQHEVSTEQQARLRHSRLHYSQQQQQQQHVLSGATNSHPLLPLGHTATAAAAAEAALAALQLQPILKASYDADAAAAAAAAARDALVQSLVAADAAAAVHELAQLQLLNHTSSNSMPFASDHLSPGWGMIHGAGPSLSRYGSGMNSAGSGFSSGASAVPRSSSDYASSGPGLTAPGWALTASGLTSLSSGLTAPGWGWAGPGLARSGSSGLTGPGWGSASSGWAEPGSTGLTAAGQGVTAPGWGLTASGQVASGPGHLTPGQELQPTALMHRPQQPQGCEEHMSGHQAQDPILSLHGLRERSGLQAANNNHVMPQISSLQGVPGLFPCRQTPSVPVTGSAAAYHRGLNTVTTGMQHHPNTPILTSATQAVALHQQMLDAALSAHGAAAAAAAAGAGAGGMVPSQYAGGFSTGLQDSSRQAFWQLQQDRCNQQ